MKNKSCPICKSEVWNYDVVIGNGECFCGDCWHEVKNQAYKLGLFSTANMSNDIYISALKNTKSLYASLHGSF